MAVLAQVAWFFVLAPQAAVVTVQGNVPSFEPHIRRYAAELSATLGVAIDLGPGIPSREGAGAWARADMDIRRIYTLLAGTADGPRWASRLQRVGLDQLQMIRFESTEHEGNVRVGVGRVAPLAGRALEVVGEARAWGPWRAPPSMGVPLTVWASVRPTALWGALSRVAALEDPLAYGLYRTQLDSLADQLHIDWMEALGQASQPLAACRMEDPVRDFAWGVAMRIGNGGALARLTAAYGEVLIGLGAPIRTEVAGVSTTVWVDAPWKRRRAGTSSLVLRFGDFGVAWAASEPALRCARAALERSSSVAPDARTFMIASRSGGIDGLGGRWSSARGWLEDDAVVFELVGTARTAPP